MRGSSCNILPKVRIVVVLSLGYSVQIEIYGIISVACDEASPRRRLWRQSGLLGYLGRCRILCKSNEDMAAGVASPGDLNEHAEIYEELAYE